MEIEIRAWDKRTKTMKYPEPYYKGEKDINCPEFLKGKYCYSQLIDENGNKSHISDILINDYYVPMLYIGKKDIKEKKIYEGDKIKGTTYWGMFGGETVAFEGIVEYDKEKCGFYARGEVTVNPQENIGKLKKYFPIHEFKNIEIIGNIFEG
jgi:uncharacterized phage protein (TIGR01671 family)